MVLRSGDGGCKLNAKLEYSFTSILNSVDGLSSTLAVNILVTVGRLAEGVNTSIIYGSWIPCEVFRALQTDGAGLCKARVHAHPKPSNGATTCNKNLLAARRSGNTQCPRSARAVPAQCPRQCPPGKHSSARGSLIFKRYRGFPFLLINERTAGTALIPRRALSRALCGHCAGTARALCIS